MITELFPQDVIAYCRSVLGTKAETDELEDVLLVGLLRRCAGILCPCSRAALRTSLMESLSYLHPDSGALADQLDNLVDDMIVVGDLLELSDVTTDDPNVKGTWIFAAPPSFIVRRSGSVLLTGIVPDQDSFLPAALDARMVSFRTTRSIVPEPGEDLAEALIAQGLKHLPEAVWVRTPKIQAPDQLIARFEKQLAVVPTCGSMNSLEILDPSTKVTYYPGRWSEPRNQSGTFVARRPQEFGAPLWSLVELVEGNAKRVIDLPPRNYRWRGCDAAWHLQMAIDRDRELPQRYRRRTTDSGVRFDFFSPLPLWAQRRLTILGRECPREGCLVAYEVPIAEADEEERYLQQSLWLMPVDD